MTTFVPGVQLAAQLYTESVAPALAGVPHAAARIGPGSDVLGFDDERSTDHGWRAFVVVFVDEGRVDDARASIGRALPRTFRGLPQEVTVTSLPAWLGAHLGFDASDGSHEIDPIDWLLVPQQLLLEVTRGAVFADDRGDLGRVRTRLSGYPEDVWLWMLACQWHRIAQEEAFVGRTAEVGDELGSRLVASRLARELMRLWFLFARAYWPYTKWFGSSFARLPGSGPLADALTTAVVATDHDTREASLVTAYDAVAQRHNELGITEPLDVSTRSYYDRPFRVLMSDRFADACTRAPALTSSPSLAGLPLVGSIDQIADSTDLLSHSARPRTLRALYEIA